VGANSSKTSRSHNPAEDNDRSGNAASVRVGIPSVYGRQRPSSATPQGIEIEDIGRGCRSWNDRRGTEEGVDCVVNRLRRERSRNVTLDEAEVSKPPLPSWLLDAWQGGWNLILPTTTRSFKPFDSGLISYLGHANATSGGCWLRNGRHDDEVLSEFTVEQRRSRSGWPFRYGLDKAASEGLRWRAPRRSHHTGAR